MKTNRLSRPTAPLELVWSHCGVRHKVTAWPELAFCRESDGGWTEFTPDPSSFVFASAAVGLDRSRWAQFLEYLPAREREIVSSFKADRLAALAVIARCPALKEDLFAAPALVSFLASHVALRGTLNPRWDEINAVYERAGIYGLLEWLGLPASRQTLAILQRVDEPHVPRRLLEPLRAALWEPETLWLLQHAPALTEQELHSRCAQGMAA